jgi:hypothetical protein
MIGKIITVVVVLAMLILSLSLFYQNLPQDPVTLKVNETAPEPIAIVNYGAVPLFADNLRFNHNIISYSIEDECAGSRRGSMVEAFTLFANEMKIISFYELADGADISVGCSDKHISMGENLFAAGEGGPSVIINTSVFKTIEKGKISLFDDSRCDYPVVAVHELGHVFGFDHSPDPDNIMYNVSDCDQRISEDMVRLINNLYSIEALPDAVVGSVNAVKRGKYLDFNITILNEGLIDISDITLSILADGRLIKVVEMGEIGIGYGRTLKATNANLQSRNVEVVEFVLDKNNRVREFNEDNNVIQMTLSSQ